MSTESSLDLNRPSAWEPTPHGDPMVPSDEHMMWASSAISHDTPTPKPERARRFGPRSLTARLVSGVVLLVVVVVTSAGFSTYYALRSFLYDRLDQQIAQVANTNEQRLANCLRLQFNRQCSIVSTSGGVGPTTTEWIALLDGTGTAQSLGAGDSEVRPMLLTAAARAAIVANPTTVRTVVTTDGDTIRISARSINVSGGPYLVSGLSTGELTKTLDRLVEIELGIGASAVLLAFVATGYGVNFSLRRLHRITSTAQEVAAELSPEGTGLDRRVPVTDPGTEVGRLATSMNTLLSAVEMQFAARLENERRMRQFLADASHELRTPLTSIRGYAELARMQRALGETEEDNLARIESEGTRMSRLVEDLLTLARGDQGTLPERVPVDVAELLDDGASSARAAFPDRQIVVDAASGQWVVGDHDQLLRVVRNLITNAAVHTRAEGAITLRAFRDGPGVAVQVIDQGPGLPSEETAHVFERFWRADRARSRVRGGSGLGLAIVASTAQAHGGTVHFESTVERGSTVTVWLPVLTA